MTRQNNKLVLVALLLIGAMAILFGGCGHNAPLGPTTAENIRDAAGAVTAAVDKLTRAEPGIPAGESRTLVHEANFGDLQGTAQPALKAGVKAAGKDASTISSQADQLDRSSVAARLRAWSTWFIVGGILLGIGGAFLWRITPLVAEVAPFVVGAGILCNWLSTWWGQLAFLLLAAGAVAWFAFSPFPNRTKKKAGAA
jgi:hypothetical protein